ncbi:MAG: cytochrome ubiquinol oxidase subunit I [Pseudomonadota bacterium]
MNYPIWHIPSVGGGLLIAIISILHVYVAHFAIGGGLFLVITEMKGYRENSQDIIDYTKRHAKFFLLLTMVFGSITGVGIWFIISLVHPSATSILIHNFVFGWATEWVFFVGEIVSLFIYFYTFDRMDRKNHLLIGWLYFIFAWLSLFIINGIVTFMLTPGDWLLTGDFWDGFFNPTFWPSLFFRTSLALMLAGLFGFLTSTAIKERGLRETMIRYCARWLILPMLILPLMAYWYLSWISGLPQGMIKGRSPELIPFVKTFIWLMPILFLGGIVMAIRMPSAIKRSLAFLLLIGGLLYMGSFEWIREASRRPYIIYDYMYSNAVLKSQMDEINEKGFLRKAKWVKTKIIDHENFMAVGEEIFNLQCLSCHTVGGFVNDILPRTAKFAHFGMDAMLNGLGKINDYMPPFMGTVKEREAVASYIVNGLHKKPDMKRLFPPLKQLALEIPPFDENTDKYILLAWSDLGIRFISDNDSYFNISPPGNTIFAQLIKRGETPQLVTEGIDLSYKVETGFERPSRHVDFWKFVNVLFGRSIENDVGLNGNAPAGKMTFKKDFNSFEAAAIPIVPYRDDQLYNPYPLVTIEARDKESGKIIVSTMCVAPISTEMGCKNCHGGRWRFKDMGGLDAETAMDLLGVHDRMSKTQLLESAKAGSPKRCQSCHSDQIYNVQGKPELLNLSASMHGFHANYMTGRGADACEACHPVSSTGFTRGFRGIHARMGLTCVTCHGTLEDHALSLLLKEYKDGKEGAMKLMRHLKPRLAPKKEEIQPRSPWVNEPDCLTCHIEFRPPLNNASGFNRWTKNKKDLYRLRSDEMGILCTACHGSTHALYPAVNPYGKNRDNLQPDQYQKMPYPLGSNKNCKVCHTIDMADEMHHPNSLRMVRTMKE